MKIFKRFGCGCVGILLEDGRQIVVEDCGSYGSFEDEGPHFTSPINRILPENVATSEFLSEQEHERLFDKMNHQMANGRRFQQIQRLLGVEVKS